MILILTQSPRLFSSKNCEAYKIILFCPVSHCLSFSYGWTITYYPYLCQELFLRIILNKILKSIIYSGWKCLNQPEHKKGEEASRSGSNCRTLLIIDLSGKIQSELFSRKERPDDRNDNNRYHKADKDQPAARFYIIQKAVMSGSQYQRIGRRPYRRGEGAG